jgi:predicted nucleic acid-binding protein
MYLLDTNRLSSDWVTKHGSWLDGPLFTSSVSAQELLGMQVPDKETGYRYALPVLDERFVAIRNGMPPDELVRWAIDHAKRIPVSKHTDRLSVPRSRLRAESLELGHAAIAVAHNGGHDRLLRAFASRGLRGKTLKRVLSKWEFLRSDVEAVIPLDEEIAAKAVVLANQFIEDKCPVKGTKRNTMNDMYVAATSQVQGIPLLTDDAQLKGFYQKRGWSVTERDSVFVATPSTREVDILKDLKSPSDSRAYINRPPWIRSRVNQAPPPLPR